MPEGNPEGYRRLDNPRQILEFLDWYEQIAKERGINPNPYDSRHFYDVEGFYKSGGKPGRGRQGHSSSKFKKWNSPERFVDDLGAMLDTILERHVPKPQSRGY